MTKTITVIYKSKVIYKRNKASNEFMTFVFFSMSLLINKQIHENKSGYLFFSTKL